MMGRIILLKLQPNQDVTEALERAIRDAGMTTARICGAVGSLVEAIIEQDGVQTKISGPGVEVAGLSGRIDTRGRSHLEGFVCRPNTGLEYGRFVRGMNAVGVTFELALEEIG
jgi:predicted DNA-binding protein with PD1-like motif